MSDDHVHRYDIVCSWKGSTGAGYDIYDRTHTVSIPAAATTMEMSADPGYRGDPARLNPEQLLLLAASSCQLLSFLAVAALARVDVIAYSDDATALMPVDDKPVRITRITLRPAITVAGEVGEDRLQHLVEAAHRACFIANSVRSDIVIEPTFRRT